MILFDATPLQSEHRFRGVGTYTRHLSQSLLKLIPDTLQFLVASRPQDVLPIPVRKRATALYRPHTPAQVYWLYNEGFLRYALGKIRPQLFHATDFNGLIRTVNVPTVATLYDLMPLKDPKPVTSLSDRMSDLRWRVYFRHKLMKADHIIAISQAVRNDAITMLDIPPETVTTIPLGVEVERFAPPDLLAPASHPPYFLFTGSRSPNKNLTRVLDAFCPLAAEYPELHFYLSGPWKPDDQRWLEGYQRRLARPHQLQHLGFVPDERLPALYQHAVAVVFPSLDEGFGLPILEAMASGTPVLTSNQGPIVEIALGAALCVDPLDTNSIFNGMHALAADASLRATLTRQGLQRAQLYDWDRVAQQTLAVYRHFTG